MNINRINKKRRAFTSCAAVAAILLAAPLQRAAAQETPSKELKVLIDKARAALDAGDGAFARNTLDSLVTASPSGSADLAEALFWRGVLAESVADAERDWKRLIVESPLSPRAAEALVRLSELEGIRGDRNASRAHAERLLMDHATSPHRARALLLVAKSWFGENNANSGCTALAQLEPLATTGELKLQHDELRPRCAALAQTNEKSATQKTNSAASSENGSKGAPTKQAATTGSPPATTSTDSASDNASESTQSSGKFSVQLAAYAKVADANAMVKRLAGMNIKARVDGKSAPYRVRTGMYATRAEAADALAQFEKRGIKGFVAEITP